MDDRLVTRVHTLATITMIAAYILIVAGGLVTSRDAGLAVPDWPLAFGELNPPKWWTIVNVRTEHAHRIIAFAVASLTGILAVVIHRVDTRPLVRRLGFTAAGLVLVQAALGGARVLALSIDLAMVHGWLGQMYFGVLVALATASSPLWQTRSPVEESCDSRLRALTAGLLGCVIVQLVLGIAIRHAGEAARPLLGNAVFYAHAVLAFAIVGLVWSLGVAVRDSSLPTKVVRRQRALEILIGLQVLVGFVTLGLAETMTFDRQATMLESWVPTIHVAIGAAALGLAIFLSLHARPGLRGVPSASQRSKQTLAQGVR